MRKDNHRLALGKFALKHFNMRKISSESGWYENVFHGKVVLWKFSVTHIYSVFHPRPVCNQADSDTEHDLQYAGHTNAHSRRFPHCMSGQLNRHTNTQASVCLFTDHESMVNSHKTFTTMHKNLYTHTTRDTNSETTTHTTRDKHTHTHTTRHTHKERETHKMRDTHNTPHPSHTQ